jgi:hypothetical protein
MTEEQEKAEAAEAQEAPEKPPVPSLDGDNECALHSRWSFWYHRRGGGNVKNVDYNDMIKAIGSFGTVEAFWKIYDHIVRPNEFKVTTDYHVFREGVKPTCTFLTSLVFSRIC